MAGLFTESKHPRGRDGKFVDVIGRMQAMGGKWHAKEREWEVSHDRSADLSSLLHDLGLDPSTTTTSVPGAAKVRAPELDVLVHGRMERLLVGKRDTRSLHARIGSDGRAVYNTKRRELHAGIAGEMLAGTKPATGRPQAVFMGGGGGGGKGTIQSRLSLPENAAHLDADEVKAKLPEYRAAIAAGHREAAMLVHEESSDVIKGVQAIAREQNINAIIDGTGDSAPGNLAGKLQSWNDAGYDVSLRMVTLDVKEAKRRVRARYERTGRYVPDDVVEAAHVGAAANFPSAAALPFVDVELYDTGVAKGEQPILIARKAKGGEIEVLDPERYAAFQRRGGITDAAAAPS